MWFFQGGICGCSQGGMRGCSQGAGVVALGGHAWLLLGGCGCSRGVCMVAPGGDVRGCSQAGMCGCSRGACVVVPRGHVWLLPGGTCVVAAWGACMVAPRGGMHGFSRRALCRIRQDTVNERAVCILLECILVFDLQVCNITLSDKIRIFRINRKLYLSRNSNKLLS